MKTKLALHVRKYRISLKSLSSDLERRAGFFFSIFPLQGIVSYFRERCKRKWRSEAIFHDWKNYDIDTNTDNEGLFVKNLKDRRRVHAKTQIGSFSVECNLKKKLFLSQNIG